MAARAVLAVALEQPDDDLDRVAPRGRALQGQAEQVHPDQAGLVAAAGLADRLAGEDGLVADDQAVLVRAHLGAHIHHGRDSTVAKVEGLCGMARWVTVTLAPGTWTAAGCHWRTWASLGSRSLFLANSTPPSVSVTAVSHTSPGYVAPLSPQQRSARAPGPGGCLGTLLTWSTTARHRCGPQR